jgi:hypothetical protein
MAILPSVKISWMDLFCEFYDGRWRLEMCAPHWVVILMYTDGFEPTVTEASNCFASYTVVQTMFGYTASFEAV